MTLRDLSASRLLDICTQIGCSVACLKYCPQELIVSRHTGDRVLTLGNFKKLVSTVPIDVVLAFSGVSEPFQNQECTDMILHAYEKGYPIVVFTTLVGLTVKDAERIMDIPFERLTLHLPDAEGIAHIPLTEEYYKVLGLMLTHVHNIAFMSMGSSFISSRQEEVFREGTVQKKSYTPNCNSFEIPHYILQPNGEVYFCCQTKALTGNVGSLYKNSYIDLASPEVFQQHVKRLRDDRDSICYTCQFSEPFWWYHLQKLKSKFTGNRKLQDYVS